MFCCALLCSALPWCALACCSLLCSAHEPPRSRQGRLKSAPKAAQELPAAAKETVQRHPRVAQERPGAGRERPESRAVKRTPGAAQGHPRGPQKNLSFRTSRGSESISKICHLKTFADPDESFSRNLGGAVALQLTTRKENIPEHIAGPFSRA